MGRILGMCLGSLQRRSRLHLLLGMLLAPTLASAERIDLVRNVEIPPAVSGKTTKPVLGLNENGDVTIYYRNLSLTMSYTPTDLLPPPRERVALNTSPESTATGGFGIKLGFAF